jgi:hypothetical protein
VTVADNSRFKPNQTFEKVWRIKNAGSCAWSGGFKWVHVSGDLLGTTREIDVPPATANGTVDLKVRMMAPDSSGQYKGVWQMRSPAGQNFGTLATVVIRVEALTVEMNTPVQLGQWKFRVVDVDRQKDVWRDDSPYYADGVFALVRLKVTYFGPGKPLTNPSTMSGDLRFTVRDDKDRVFDARADEEAGERARWMVGNQASIRNGIRINAPDWPVLIAFDVAEDSQELWLDVSSIADSTRQVSIHLSPLISKREQMYGGKFIDAPRIS